MYMIFCLLQEGKAPADPEVTILFWSTSGHVTPAKVLEDVEIHV